MGRKSTKAGAATLPTVPSPAPPSKHAEPVPVPPRATASVAVGKSKSVVKGGGPGTAWSFDRASGVLTVNKKDFKLAVSEKDLVAYAEMVLQLVRAYNSLAGVIGSFEAGLWKDYTNAAQRIKVLHHEQSNVDLSLKSTAAQFDTLFQPAGIYQEFAADGREFSNVVRSLMSEIAKG
jgi:hypothetical protein